MNALANKKVGMEQPSPCLLLQRFACIISVLLMSFCFILDAQALTLTYNYVGPQLTPYTSNPPHCPASIGNITITATLLEYGCDTYCDSYYTMTAFGLSLQGNYPVIDLIGTNGEVIESYSIGSSGPLDPSNVVSMSEAYGLGTDRDSVTIGDYFVGFFCDYTTTEQGTWSGGTVQAPQKDIGKPSAPTEPQDLPSSSANPTALTQNTCPGNNATDPIPNLGNSAADPAPNALCGNPIDSATGNKLQTETDFTASPNTGLSLVRYYNSLDTGGSAFGSNWRTTWHRALTVSGTTVTVTRADGRQDTFTNNNGVYTADPDVTSVLTATTANGVITGYKLLTASDATETYAANGTLLSIASRDGLTTTLSYNGSNQLSTVTGPFGHVMSFAYDSSGRVVQTTAPDGGVYAYAYDANNNLIAVTYPDKSTRQYVYNEQTNTANTNQPHALTGIIDELGNRFATWGYNAQGAAISSQHAGGAELTTVSYGDNASTVTDANGNVHTYGFTTLFNMIKPVSLTGVPIPSLGGNAFSYDANGFIASKTDYDYNVTTYTHDARGNQTSRTEATGTAQARTITTTWHPTFHLPTQITEPNRVTTLSYDSHGNLTQKTIADASNSNNTRTWNYAYNANGQVTQADGPRTDVADITQYRYDGKGDLASVTDALGHVTTISAYDADGQPLTLQDPNGLITQLAYDPRGRLLSRNTGGETTAYSYDAAGQVLKITHPDASFAAFSYDPAHRLTQVSDNLGNKIVYTLDANDNQTKKQIYDPSSTLTRSLSQTFDAVNRLQTSVGAQGQTTTYGYDNNGNLTSVTDPLSNVTTRSFDALNRLFASIDPLSGKTQYQFDANDNLAQVTDPRSANTVYSYDGLGNKTKQTSPDTGTTTYTYDAAGNIITRTDARGMQTLYAYDALNRLIKKSFTPNSHYGDISSVTYQYDQGKYGIGHLTGMTDTSGATTWLYEIHGRMVQQQQTIGLVTLTTHYQYDAAGRLSQLTTPANNTIAYQYNANGQVNAMTVDGTVLLNSAKYQPFGPIRSWVWGNGTAYNRSYDLDGRLTKLPLGTDNRSYTYDADSRIIGETSDGTVQSVSPVFISATNAGTTNYAIKPTGNALLSETIANGTVFNMGYDVVGNLLSDGFNSYQYDLGSRLMTVGSDSFQMDGLGKRVAKVNLSTGNRYFAYDKAGHLLGEYNAQGLAIQETIWLGDTPVGTVSAGTGLLYVYADHLNTPRTVTTQSNRVLWSWVSDPFGNGAPITSNDDAGNPYQYNLRFPGQYYDAETGLHYNMARYYNPAIGRYTQSDPIGLKGGINTYTYVRNNPIKFIDNWGFDTFTEQEKLEYLVGLFTPWDYITTKTLQHYGLPETTSDYLSGGLVSSGTAMLTQLNFGASAVTILKVGAGEFIPGVSEAYVSTQIANQAVNFASKVCNDFQSQNNAISQSMIDYWVEQDQEEHQVFQY